MVALLTAAKVAGALPAGKAGGAIVSGGAKALAKGAIKRSMTGGASGGSANVVSGGTISKEPIWSSGTTGGGEYLSSGDRKALFRKSRAKISSSSSFIPTSSALAPISKDKDKISPTSSALVPSPSSEGAMTAEGMGLDTGKTLEQRVTNNEKKITVIKRIVKIQQQPFGGGQLAEVNAILQDIGNALALDFSNRISKEESEIDGLRGDKESRKRAGAEAGVEQVKKVQSSLNKAFGKVIAPAKGLLGGIFGFFGNLLKGWVADKALKWLSNNGDKVIGFFKFITKHARAILLVGGAGWLGMQALSLRRGIKAIGGLFGPKQVGGKVANDAMRRYARKFGKDKAIQKFGGKAVKNLGGKFGRSAGTNLVRNVTTKALGKSGTKQLLKIAKKFISPVVKKIPLIGALIDFALNVFVFKEPVGKAAFKAIGAGLGLWLGGMIGTLIPIPFVGTALGGWLGGMGGDALGGAIYDAIFGKGAPSASDEQAAKNTGGSKDTKKLESQATDYTKVVETIANKDTGLNFSPNVKAPSDLKGRSKGGVEIMDPITINNMIGNNQCQSGGGEESSIPIVSAIDNSQIREIENVMDGLGIEV